MRVKRLKEILAEYPDDMDILMIRRRYLLCDISIIDWKGGSGSRLLIVPMEYHGLGERRIHFSAATMKAINEGEETCE